MRIIFPVLQQGHASTSKWSLAFVITFQLAFSMFYPNTPIAIKIDPENANPYYKRGNAEISMGQKESACYDFNHALRLGLNEASFYVKL